MCNNTGMVKISNGAYSLLKNTARPEMAEKDYLECAILEKLFSDSYFNSSFVFAGGATLSKSYQLSARICQDIDLVCHDFDELPDDHSRKSLDKFKKQFRNTVFTDICNKISDLINKDNQFKILTDKDWAALKNNETFIFSPTLHLLYMSNFSGNLGHLSIEVIPRKYLPHTIEHKSVIPYSIQQEIGDIPTVRYEQTFWDKVYALHSNTASARPHYTQFYSRHYYDVAKLSHHINLKRTYNLLQDIERHQQKYTLKHIQPLSTPADLSLLPDLDGLAKLSADYKQMSDKFLGIPDDWSEIVRTLRELSAKIHTINFQRG